MKRIILCAAVFSVSFLYSSQNNHTCENNQLSFKIICEGRVLEDYYKCGGGYNYEEGILKYEGISCVDGKKRKKLKHHWDSEFPGLLDACKCQWSEKCDEMSQGYIRYVLGMYVFAFFMDESTPFCDLDLFRNDKFFMEYPLRESMKKRFAREEKRELAKKRQKKSLRMCKKNPRWCPKNLRAVSKRYPKIPYCGKRNRKKGKRK